MTPGQPKDTFPDAIRLSASPGFLRAFTLLEVVICLALVGVLAAAAAPLLSDMLARTQSDDASSAIEDAVADLHDKALKSGTAQKGVLSRTGLQPGRPLPDGWVMDIRRFADSDYRKPREGEVWTFNEAGLSEPLAIRLKGDGQSVELQFDPITGESVHD